MNIWREDCPAKLNLYLAVGGKRADGYHDLVSLVVPVSLADELFAEMSNSGADSLVCDDPEIPCDAQNLVLRAAAAFRAKVPQAPFMAWRLTKRVPFGAGLGGGSSDAAGALRILNAACANILSAAELRAVAALVGSDCPLFITGEPCLMRGRGDIVEPLPEAAAAALRGKTLALVKPHFGIPTGWAYGALDRLGEPANLPAAEAALRRWIETPCGLPPVFNSFQKVAFDKYLFYGALNMMLRDRRLPELALTGSGSAAFAFANEDEVSALVSAAEAESGGAAFAIRVEIL